MKKHTLSGIIKYDYSGDYKKLYLVDSGGLHIDMIGRVSEIKISYPENPIQVCYWTSDKPTTRNKMMEGYLMSVFGGNLEVGYENNGFMGSEWTGYIDSYDTELSIGGHDLLRELINLNGSFLIIDFNIQNT